jgi:hypothetical protein
VLDLILDQGRSNQSGEAISTLSRQPEKEIFIVTETKQQGSERINTSEFDQSCTTAWIALGAME